MGSASIPRNRAEDRRLARIALVERHVRLENAHDLEGVLGTFGASAQYEDEAWGEHYQGGSGVRQFYEQRMRALPDLQIEVQRRHVTDDAVVLEVLIRGTQLGVWRGLPATGRGVEIPLCVCIRLTPMTGWPGRESITIAGRCCGNSAFSMSHKVCWDECALLRLIR